LGKSFAKTFGKAICKMWRSENESIFMVTTMDYPLLKVGNGIPIGGKVPPRLRELTTSG